MNVFEEIGSEVVKFLKTRPEGASGFQIAEAIGRPHEHFQVVIGYLVDAKRVKFREQKYYATVQPREDLV